MLFFSESKPRLYPRGFLKARIALKPQIKQFKGTKAWNIEFIFDQTKLSMVQL